MFEFDISTNDMKGWRARDYLYTREYPQNDFNASPILRTEKKRGDDDYIVMIFLFARERDKTVSEIVEHTRGFMRKLETIYPHLGLVYCDAPEDHPDYIASEKKGDELRFGFMFLCTKLEWNQGASYQIIAHYGYLRCTYADKKITIKFFEKDGKSLSGRRKRLLGRRAS